MTPPPAVTAPEAPAPRGVGGADEHVVLLDGRGRAIGTRAKSEVHGPHTPFHLAFSCHVVRADGRVLLTRRARSKLTWPGVWTNACCGHPQLGETLEQAVTRRLREELGLVPTALAVALPDFTYRAEMADGTVEHELCPVLVARVDAEPRPDPDEVAETAWVEWPALLERAASAPGTLSPWSTTQLPLLGEHASATLAGWIDDTAAAHVGWRPAPAPSPTTAGPATADPVTSEPRGGRPPALAPVLEPLDELLGRFLGERRRQLVELDPVLAEVVDEVEGLVASGGKRLRPAFVHWGHRAAGADPDPEVLGPAAAVELLHTFALLHDDVMDRSATRRGRPAAHAALAARHRREGRDGDSEQFGINGAILAGDLTHVWADELFDGARLPPAAMVRARATFTALRSEVVAGQYLDLHLASTPADALAGRSGAGEQAAAKVALLKSARYTVTRPLLLGAALAGPIAPAVEAALRTYGDAVGTAFQMRDDVLGLHGDPAETGKGVVEDLREGKRTLLVLRALRLASPDQRQVITGALGDPDLDEAGAGRVRDVVAATGALASIEALIAASLATARAALAPLPNAAATALDDLATVAVERRS